MLHMRISLQCFLLFLFPLGLSMPGISESYYNANNNVSKSSPGLEFLFQIERVGAGYSSPAISDTMIYITGEKDGNGYIQAYRLNGELSWQQCYGPEWITSYKGSRAAPVLDSERLYVCSGMGSLVCYHAASGREIWKNNLVDDFQGITPAYGYAMPVLIEGDRLYILPGGKEHNIIALNKRTGDLIWTSTGTQETAGYAPAIIINRGDRKIYAAFTEFTFFGIDAASGKMLWKYDLNFKGELPCNEPMYRNGSIYIVAGPGNGAKKFLLSEDGSNINLKWENLDLNSAFGGFTDVETFIAGSADHKQSYVLLDKESGKIKSRINIGKGAIINASNHLIAYTQRGEVFLLEIQKDKFEILQRLVVESGSGEHFAMPVFNNKLYIRHGNTLQVYRMI